LAGLFPWIAGGVVILAGAGYLLMRRRRDPNLDPDLDAEEA
jgi:LPXTG-motif cell wall-anchored protein